LQYAIENGEKNVDNTMKYYYYTQDGNLHILEYPTKSKKNVVYDMPPTYTYKLYQNLDTLELMHNNAQMPVPIMWVRQ
jgi:hypothetical protein